MNYKRILATAIAAMAVFFTYGFLVHGLLIAPDYRPYPEGVYRSGVEAQSHLPWSLAGIFTAILIFSTIFAQVSPGKSDVKKGARLGLLFGIFMAGAFVGVNYGTIHISGKLASELAISELIEWTLVGVLVSLVYRPAKLS